MAQKSTSQLLTPLSNEELDELSQFLESDQVSDETLMIDALDGYLTAIAIGPTTLPAELWLSRLWGPDEVDAPQFASPEEAQHFYRLIFRHYNGILTTLQRDPDAAAPLFETIVNDDEEEVFDPEMWAYGFMQGASLCRRDWQPLFDDDDGFEALFPIFVLGWDEIPVEMEKLIQTLEQRAELAEVIPEGIAWIYRYWQVPRMLALAEPSRATTSNRVDGIKVGRNDPCPCGSGKKFKKCCGSATKLH